MRWYAVMLVAALTARLTVASTLHVRARQRVMRYIHRFEEGEEKCLQDNDLTKDQVLHFTCKIPPEPELQEKYEKYCLCSLVNTYQMLPNGTFVFTPFVDCSAEALATTTAAPGVTAAPARHSYLSHETRVTLCGLQAVTYDCQKEIGGKQGVSAERKAMEYRLCLCHGFMRKL